DQEENEGGGGADDHLPPVSPLGASINGREGAVPQRDYVARAGKPAARKAAGASAMVCVPKWKIDAANTALACPSVTPSTRCSSVPTPPLAITGTDTASAIARVSLRS